jgi:hypothetical protein
MDAERLQALKAILATADKHVVLGRVLVGRQRKNIAEGRFGRRNTKLAADLLAELEQSLRLHIADRDRLRSEYQLSAVSSSLFSSLKSKVSQ